MTHSFLSRLTNTLWVVITVSVLLMATYVSLGRVAVARVSEFQEPILRELGHRLNMVIEADHIRGRWTTMAPHLELEGVRILGDEHTPVALQIDRLDIGLNVPATIARLGPQMHALVVRGLDLHVDVTEDGALVIPGIPPGGGLNESLLRFLFATGSLTLDQTRLVVHESGIEHDFRVDLSLRRDEEFRRLRASIVSPSQRSWFRLIAEGSGEPTELAELLGRAHVEMHVPEVSNYTGLAEIAGFRLADGQLDGELWLDTAAGDMSLIADFAASELQVQQLVEDGRSLNLDQLAAQVHAVSSAGKWSYQASDISARIGDKTFALDTLGGSLTDGVLDLRASVVDLSSLSDYLIEEAFLPPRLADVIGILAPAGSLQTFQVLVSDFRQLFSSWRLNANFDDLSVASWRGAPAVENAAGFLSIGPRTGTVQIRSSEFSLGFPTVYRHPLGYDQFAAELGWFVGENHFQLFSGPFTGIGEEGEVRGLFSLSVPFSPNLAGLEMELMVGLEDASPEYRSKYLPYTLPETLLDWLEGSIGDASILDGGFIFRGSLRGGAKDHRSIQLYFNVADAMLQYHPEWPALSALQGTLFIDDSFVSGSNLKGQIYDSALAVERLTLTPTTAGMMELAVAGNASGPAADGLAVVLNSPLATIVGDAFTGWQLDGDLETELALRLVLGDSAMTPEVTVSTVWDDVDLTTSTLNLPINAINGELHFDWREGFSSSRLDGTLWDEPVVAKVSQRTEGGKLGLLDVQVNGEVSSDSLRQWLELDMLRLAQGRTPVELHILMPAAAPGRIEMHADLRGVALDLPPGFDKPADAASDVRVVMPLDDEQRQLDISYEDRAFLNIGLTDAGYSGASLGFGSAPLPVEPGLFLINGELDAVDAEPWWDFVETYIVGDTTAVEAATYLAPEIAPAELVEVAAVEADVAEAEFTAAEAIGAEVAEAEVVAAEVVEAEVVAAEVVAAEVVAAEFAEAAVSGAGITEAEVSAEDVAEAAIAEAAAPATEVAEIAVAAPEVPVEVRGLLVGKLCAFGICTDKLRLDAQQQPGQWQLGLALPWVSGAATVADDLAWVKLDFTRMDLAGVDAEWLEQADADAMTELLLPEIDLKIANLWSGSSRWGSVQLSIREQAEELQFRDIRGELRGMLLGDDNSGLALDWRRDSATASTHLSGPLRFVNFGDVLASFNYERFIETNSGAVQVDLTWPEGPMDFELAKISGDLQMNVDEGRFLNTSGAAEGTLRVVGIVNLAEFVRRLSLDLNSLFKSGVPFDSITGELLFDDGLIDVPLVDVAGRGSRFQFVGQADVNQETVAGELVATLPVASNLPWIAALVGGLPAAAGVFVVSRVFSEQMDRFSSGVYSIEGPWNEPEVNFERIYDDVTPLASERSRAAVTADQPESPAVGSSAASEAGEVGSGPPVPAAAAEASAPPQEAEREPEAAAEI